MASRLKPSGLREAFDWVGIALITGLACWLGMLLTREAGRVASIWLANGLLVGVLLSVPTRRWTSFLIAGLAGNLTSNLLSGDSAPLAGILALSNSLEIAIAAGGLRWLGGEKTDLMRWTTLRAFLVFGVGLGPLASATLAAAFLSSIGPVEPIDVVRVWYPADALGIAIVTPLVLVLSSARDAGSRARLHRPWPASLALALVTAGVFAQHSQPIAFLILPPLMFMVFRHGYFGAVAGIAIVALISVPLTISGGGAFALPSGNSLPDRVVLLQLFIAVCNAMALGVAMVLEERQRFEERLLQTERDLRSIADNLPALIAHVDREERYQFVNANAGRVFGGDPQQMLGRTLSEVGGDVYQDIAPHVARVLSGHAVSFESTGEVEGRTCHYQNNYIPERAADGSIGGFYAMSFDITARKEAELRQARSEKWLKSITDNIPALIAYIDRDQRFQFTNGYHQTIYRTHPSTFIGRSIRECLGEQVYAEISAQVAAVLGGEKLRFERHSRDGGIDVHLLVDYVPDRDADGQVIGFFATVMDITARKNAELRQTASEARLRTITDGLPGLIAYLDRSTRIRFCNATYEQWFGIPAAEMIGLTLDEALGSALLQAQGEFVQRALTGARCETEFEIEFRGQRRSLQASYLPHRDEAGRVLGVYTLASDVTPLKRVQKQLVQLARYDTLTGLANRGEFNTCLRAAMLRSNRSAKPLALLFMDVDHFKSINDQYGHVAGDEVLQEVANRLQAAVRRTDTVARLAGDEFVIILEGLGDGDELEFVARKILGAISRPILHREFELHVGVSIGIALHTDRTMTPGALLAAADRALYEAKAAGRNTFRICDEQAQPSSDAPSP